MSSHMIRSFPHKLSLAPHDSLRAFLFRNGDLRMFQNTAMGQDSTRERRKTISLLAPWQLASDMAPRAMIAQPHPELCGFGVSKLQICLNPESWTNYEMLWDLKHVVPLGWHKLQLVPVMAQLGSASILKRSSNPLWRRFRRWTQSYLEANMSPNTPNSENAKTDGIWWGFHVWQYQYISIQLRHRKYE